MPQDQTLFSVLKSKYPKGTEGFDIFIFCLPTSYVISEWSVMGNLMLPKSSHCHTWTNHGRFIENNEGDSDLEMVNPNSK